MNFESFLSPIEKNLNYEYELVSRYRFHYFLRLVELFYETSRFKYDKKKCLTSVWDVYGVEYSR